MCPKFQILKSLDIVLHSLDGCFEKSKKMAKMSSSLVTSPRISRINKKVSNFDQNFSTYTRVCTVMLSSNEHNYSSN